MLRAEEILGKAAWGIGIMTPNMPGSGLPFQFFFLMSSALSARKAGKNRNKVSQKKESQFLPFTSLWHAPYFQALESTLIVYYSS